MDLARSRIFGVQSTGTTEQFLRAVRRIWSDSEAYRQAEAHLEACAEYLASCRMYKALGVDYPEGTHPGPTELKSAVHILQNAALRGHEDSQASVGAIRALELPGVAECPDEWVRLAARRGDAQAQVWAVNRCRLFLSRGREYEPEILSWLETAATQGNADAQLALGRACWGGHGLPQDHVRGQRLIQQAAEQGHPSAQYGLVDILIESGRPTTDYNAAVNWAEKYLANPYRERKHEGVSVILLVERIAVLHAYGFVGYLETPPEDQRFPINYNKAIEWFARAECGPRRPLDRRLFTGRILHPLSVLLCLPSSTSTCSRGRHG